MQTIDFINTTRDEVTEKLRTGMTPGEVAAELQEPVQNVMGVWSDLRNNGMAPSSAPAVQARPAQPVPRSPASGAIESLIGRAASSKSAATRRLGIRVEEAIEKLTAALDNEAAAEATRRREDERREALRKAVRDAEKALTEARDAWRSHGKPKGAQSIKPPPCSRAAGRRRGSPRLGQSQRCRVQPSRPRATDGRRRLPRITGR